MTTTTATGKREKKQEESQQQQLHSTHAHKEIHYNSPTIKTKQNNNNIKRQRRGERGNAALLCMHRKRKKKEQQPHLAFPPSLSSLSLLFCSTSRLAGACTSNRAPRKAHHPCAHSSPARTTSDPTNIGSARPPPCRESPAHPPTPPG